MNRLFTLMALLLVTHFNATAQITTGRTTSRDSLSSSKMNTVDSSEILIEQRLVDLALKGPSYSASNHQNRINELELQKAKNAWLNLLSISTNYNDQSFAKNTQNANIVYPKYFFGLTIPLGVIISRGTEVKSAREVIALSVDQQKILARKIKSDVVGKYRQYKLYNGLIEIQSVLINDLLANALQAEDNFRKGKITVEAYITAQRTRNEELAKNMTLKYEQDIVRLGIEEMTGVSLEEALNPPPPPATPTK
ncbi:MAG: TolC family protein [Chitinophagaceae bacterium]|nr:TolC family protein [Chitinophagaceae bacterium]